MKFTTRLIIITSLILSFASRSHAEEIRSTVSPGVVQITQNPDQTFSFRLCRGGENVDCSQIGNRPSYSLNELAFRYKTLHKQGAHTIEMDGCWVIGSAVVAGIVMIAQATPAAPAVDGAVVTAVDTTVAADTTAVAVDTVATGAAEAESSDVVAEEAANETKEVQAIAKAVSKIRPRFNGPLTTSGLALAGSIGSLVHSWFEPGSTSSPIYKFTIAKTLSPGSLEGTVFTTTIPIEDYAQQLDTALNSEY